jgi:hypothetical protein
MPKTDPDPQYIIDCHGLEYISHTRNNMIRAKVYHLLETGILAIPQAVWDEFREIYEDEADDLGHHIKQKIRSKPKHRAMAGAIASKANSGFRPEPYSDSDWIAIAVAETESCILVTVPQNTEFYANLAGDIVIAIGDLP